MDRHDGRRTLGATLSPLVLMGLVLGCTGPADGPTPEMRRDAAASPDGGPSTTGDRDGGPSTSDPDGGPVVEGDIREVSVDQITATSARITWAIPGEQVGTGQVEYGLTADYGEASTKETRLIWSEHIQTITGLTPDSLYHFRVLSELEDGTVLVSGNHTFMTTGAPEPGEGWPTGASDTLPLAGVFYGKAQIGMLTGNSRIARQNARRFMARKSGTVTHVSFNNRVMEEGTAATRCRNGGARAYCACVDAGLNDAQCTYTLGNSYSVGNGGRITVELRRDDGTDNHWPDMSEAGLVARTRPYVPLEEDNRYPTFPLIAPGDVVAGHIYHLVYVNDNYPTTCALRGNSPSEARRCPQDQGAIGLNGVQIPRITGSALRGVDPLRGTVDRVLYGDTTDAWSEDEDNLSWYELIYADGQQVGDTYIFYNAIYNAGGRYGYRDVHGSNEVRQVFTVEDASRSVNGVWVAYGYSGGRASGAPLRFRLVEEGGSELASGTLPHDPECARLAETSSSRTETSCQSWGYAAFGRAIELMLGRTYALELRADSGAHYRLLTSFDGDYGPFPGSRDVWRSARAEYRSGGGSWRELSGANYYPGRDLAVLFTIEGMPTALNQ